MGTWWHDPNSAVISVEIEGFAAKGPNIDQRNSLASLVADVRSRYPGMGLLGHRDFADYKACPGAFIPWPKLGGHGPYVSPVVSYSLIIAPHATVRAYVLGGGTVVPHCIESWTDTTWSGTASSAPCMAPISRKTCDRKSSATTVFVTAGTFKGKHVRLGHGTTLKETAP